MHMSSQTNEMDAPASSSQPTPYVPTFYRSITPRNKPCKWCHLETCDHCRCPGFTKCDHSQGHLCDKSRYKRRLVCNPCEKNKLHDHRLLEAGLPLPPYRCAITNTLNAPLWKRRRLSTDSPMSSFCTFLPPTLTNRAGDLEESSDGDRSPCTASSSNSVLAEGRFIDSLPSSSVFQSSTIQNLITSPIQYTLWQFCRSKCINPEDLRLVASILDYSTGVVKGNSNDDEVDIEKNRESNITATIGNAVTEVEQLASDAGSSNEKMVVSPKRRNVKASSVIHLNKKFEPVPLTVVCVDRGVDTLAVIREYLEKHMKDVIPNFTFVDASGTSVDISRESKILAWTLADEKAGRRHLFIDDGSTPQSNSIIATSCTHERNIATNNLQFLTSAIDVVHQV